MQDFTTIGNLTTAGQSGKLSTYSQARPGELIPDLMAMIGTMPRRSESSLDMEATLEILEADLRELPVDLVRDALKKFRTGQIGDGWAPSGAAIGKYVRERMAIEDERSLRAEAQAKIERETIAERGRRQAQWEAQTPEQRKAVVEAALPKALRSENVSAPQWLEDIAGRQPTKVESFSDELVGMLRGMSPREAAE